MSHDTGHPLLGTMGAVHDPHNLYGTGTGQIHNRPAGGHTSREVAHLTGITYRQLYYWTRTGRIAPSIARGEGSGNYWWWSDYDIELLERVGLHLKAGLTLDAALRHAKRTEVDA